MKRSFLSPPHPTPHMYLLPCAGRVKILVVESNGPRIGSWLNCSHWLVCPKFGNSGFLNGDYFDILSYLSYNTVIVHECRLHEFNLFKGAYLTLCFPGITTQSFW
jgi:hypothetical protein